MTRGIPIATETASRIDALHRNGLSRYEVAAHLGIHYRTVCRYTSTPLCRCPRVPGVVAFFWDAGAA